MNLFSRNAQIERQDGQRFVIKGLSYFGFESDISVLHGLWAQSLTSIVNCISDHNFNFVRIPFSIEMALNLDQKTTVVKGIDYQLNPQLQYKTSAEILDYFISLLASKNIFVLLDNHNMKAGGKITELWYDNNYGESEVIKAWGNMAARYKNTSNVIAADLKNEPHGQCLFGGGQEANDWSMAATRIGNAILTVCPHWLIFVEGTEKGMVQCPDCFWGQNLASVQVAPVQLQIKDKLVYSCHSYGPATFMHDYFNDMSALPKIWDQQFGFIVKNKLGPALVTGEWGGRSPEPKANNIFQLDSTWMNCYAKYLKDNDMQDNFFWALNPNSEVVAGLLLDDWCTLDSFKLNLCNDIHINDSNSGKATVNPCTVLNVGSAVVSTIVADFKQTKSEFKVSTSQRKNSTWQKDGKTLYLIDIVVKTFQTYKTIILRIEPPSAIEQIWNVEVLGKGIVKIPQTMNVDQTFVFGGVFVDNINVTVSSTM